MACCCYMFLNENSLHIASFFVVVVVLIQLLSLSHTHSIQSTFALFCIWCLCVRECVVHSISFELKCAQVELNVWNKLLHFNNLTKNRVVPQLWTHTHKHIRIASDTYIAAEFRAMRIIFRTIFHLQFQSICFTLDWPVRVYVTVNDDNAQRVHISNELSNQSYSVLLH